MTPQSPDRRQSRAVLLGVHAYAHFPPLPQVRESLRSLAAALAHRGFGILPARHVHVPQRLDKPFDLLRPLSEAASEATDLLLVYFAGHGRVDHRTNELLLMVGGSERRPNESHPYHDVVRWAEVRDLVRGSQARYKVVILDCCYAGNAFAELGEGHAGLYLLACVQANRRVYTGPHTDGTTFSRQLGTLLAEGIEETEPVTLNAVFPLLKAFFADQRTVEGSRWEPQYRTYQPLGDPVLSHQRRRPLPLPGLPKRHPVWSAVARAAEAGAALWRGLVSWARKPAVYVTALALLAATLVALWHRPPPSPCPPPLELRMAVAPEEVAPMTELLQVFEDSPANHRDAGDAEHCLASRITVFGAGLDALAAAFTRADDWGSGRSDALVKAGPQPDLWAAQSSAEVTYVRGALAPSQGEIFASQRVMAHDEPVLVLTEDARKRLGLPTAADLDGLDWRRLRAAFKRPGARQLRLLRPNPTVSGVGLVHTLGMHSQNHDADREFGPNVTALPGDEIAWLETEVIGLGRSVADGSQALCELRTAEHAGAGAKPAAGALVSRRQADQLRHPDDEVGDDCPAPTGAPVQVYTLDGVPPLDYPLVEVRWDPADQARHAAVDRLRHWLNDPGKDQGLNTLAGLGYGGPQDTAFNLAPSSLGDWLDRFRVAHPNLRLSVLFDVSGSMRELKRFPTAREAVSQALRGLGADDRYALHVFPTGRDGHGSKRLIAERQASDRRAVDPPELAKLAPRPVNDRYTDLLGALRDTVAELPDYGTDFQHAVLLVTDGEYLRGKAPRLPEIRDWAEKLRERGVPVIVASMRPYGCTDGHEPEAVATSSGGECVALSDDLPTEVARAVAALTEGRRL